MSSPIVVTFVTVCPPRSEPTNSPLRGGSIPLGHWEDLRAHYFRQEHPRLNDDQIFTEREEKFATLLYEISQVLGYKFGRTHARDNIYRPQLHGTIEQMELETLTRVLDLLRSDALPIRFVTGPPAPLLQPIPLDELRDAPTATALPAPEKPSWRK